MNWRWAHSIEEDLVKRRLSPVFIAVGGYVFVFVLAGAGAGAAERQERDGTRHTDLIFDKPAGQLLRRAVPLPLDASDEDGVVAGLTVQGTVHGLFLV